MANKPSGKPKVITIGTEFSEDEVHNRTAHNKHRPGAGKKPRRSRTRKRPRSKKSS